MPPFDTSRRSAAYQPALAWFAAIGGAWVFALVMLGAYTTSIGAGMAFPDWPLSNGSLNPKGWLTDNAMFSEHAHRLSAGLMTIVTIAIAGLVWVAERRAWVRKLAGCAVGLVFAQALAGGLRVLLEKFQVDAIHTSWGRLLAMLHACLAQIFVCTLLAVALSLSRGWIEGRGAAVGSGVRRLANLCCGLLLVQLAIAAVMRHTFSGLAIPTFPASTPAGGLLPATWNFGVGINFAHRSMAALLALALPALAVAIWRDSGAGRGMKRVAAGLVGLLALQITLGAEVIWQNRDPAVTTAHVVVGACTLATTFGLAWWAHRPVLAIAAATAPAAAAADVGQPSPA